MESPSPIDSATKNPPKETFTTYSPPKPTAPSSTKQPPSPTTSLPRSTGGFKTTTMSSPATEDPSPEPTSQDPVTTATTTEPPETTATTTTDVVTTTTETTSDRPVTTETTTSRTSSNVVTITTTTPYTTRYVTTMSIVTIKTFVPRPTMISGSVTTIFIPVTTAIETPTLIPDPNQPPPGVVSNANEKKAMPPWQVMLIVAACLIVAAAGSAVLLIGRIKKRRREREAQQHFKFEQQQHPHQKEVMFGIGRGDESVLESTATDASGAMSNRTLISSTGRAEGVYNTGGANAGGLRGWMERFRSWTPWDSHRAYHGPAHPPGGGVGHGRAGRLWLMEEDSELGANEHAFAAADMRPVSYHNEDSAGGVAFMQQRQYQQPHQQGYQDMSMQGQQGSPRQVSYPLPPMSQSSRMSSASATTAHSNHNVNEHATTGSSTNASSSPSLLHPLLEERVSMGLDHVDGRGSIAHRVSLDGGVLAGNNRSSMYVDPATLELHSMCEHIRKAPQALPDSGSPANRVVDAGEGQERLTQPLERAVEEGQERDLVDACASIIPQIPPGGDGEAKDVVVEPHISLEGTTSLEARRKSLEQVQAAAPTVILPAVNMEVERGLQGSSVHESEPDDVFYMCPESPIGTTAPDDNQSK
ncbi:hypothetical protein BGZ72_003869 [Mortierella alpina]|nr:hypothetical protein BGZ72_003869 [Mortierella alpina]